MRYSAFLAFSVFLMVTQTVVLYEMSAALRFYDLLVPLVIYFSLYRPFREGLPIILLTGIMMDMLSAAPIGIYMTVYLWLYVAFRQTWRVIQVKQNLLFPMVVTAGVLFENIVFCIIIILQNGVPGLFPDAVNMIGAQLLWAVFTSPFMLILLHALFQLFDRLGAGNLQESEQS